MIKENIRVGKLTLKSRIIMPPMATYLGAEDGTVTEKLLSFYAERSANRHIGMVITEHAYITLQGKAKERQLSLASDGDIEGLKKLVEVIHQNGLPAMAQLNHAGSGAPFSATGMPTVSSSAVVLPAIPPMGDGTVPSELSKDQIKEITALFAAAAKRAKSAGYDGVVIHSAHAYLLDQFYSPLANHRTDEYGGSLDNRLRFHKEVIRSVREAVGADLIISVRLGGCDYREGGSTIEDSVYASKVFEEEGVDLIDLSGGMCRYTRPGHEEPGYFQDMSSAIRKAVSIPVLLTGGVTKLAEAEELLEKGAADLIGVGRALLKDPKWEEE